MACGKVSRMPAYTVPTQESSFKPDGRTVLASFKDRISGVSGYTEGSIYTNCSDVCFHISNMTNGEKMPWLRYKQPEGHDEIQRTEPVWFRPFAIKIAQNVKTCNFYLLVYCGAFLARLSPGFLRSLARASRVR